MLLSSEANVNRLDGWMDVKKRSVQITAGTIQAVAPEGAVTPGLLKGYQPIDKEFNDIYLGTTSGAPRDPRCTPR